jgi:predicted enzyme related to lactoylglutathione lyase
MLGYFAIHAPDTGRAKDFYHSVFGWTYVSHGDYHHIEDSSPAGGITTGEPRIEPSFVVPDAAAAAAAAGDKATEPVRSDSGWSFAVRDGHGGSLALWQPGDGYADDNPKCAVGDLFYFVLPVANDAAREFYAELLGWELTPGSHENGWNIANITPPGGVFVSRAAPPEVYFQVEDVEQAAKRIRAAGGTAGEIEPNSAGQHAACRDDQGISFSIGSLSQK